MRAEIRLGYFQHPNVSGTYKSICCVCIHKKDLLNSRTCSWNNIILFDILKESLPKQDFSVGWYSPKICHNCAADLIYTHVFLKKATTGYQILKSAFCMDTPIILKNNECNVVSKVSTPKIRVKCSKENKQNTNANMNVRKRKLNFKAKPYVKKLKQDLSLKNSTHDQVVLNGLHLSGEDEKIVVFVTPDDDEVKEKCLNGSSRDINIFIRANERKCNLNHSEEDNYKISKENESIIKDKGECSKVNILIDSNDYKNANENNCLNKDVDIYSEKEQDFLFSNNNEITMSEKMENSLSDNKVDKIETFSNQTNGRENENNEIKTDTYKDVNSMCEIKHMNDQQNSDMTALTTSTVRTGMTKFKCSLCRMVFFNVFQFKLHVSICSKLNKYLCDVCGAKFSWMSSLKDHYRIHAQIVIFVCQQCRKEFTNKSLLNKHYATHMKLTNLSELVSLSEMSSNHKLDEESESNKIHCVGCGKGFESKEQLYHHICIHIGSENYPDRTVEEKDVGVLEELGKCHKEQDVIVSEEKEVVVVEELGKSDKEQDVIIVEEKDVVVVEDAVEEVFECDEEPDVVLVEHAEETKFECDEEEDAVVPDHTGAFESVHEQDAHTEETDFEHNYAHHEVVVEHAEDPVFKCARCMAIFKKNTRLWNHMVTAHYGRKKFICSYCDKAFICSSKLKLHLDKHAKETKFTCSLCNRSFRDAFNFRRHFLSEHRVVE